LFKKTNIDLNIIQPQSWAVLSNSSKVPKDIWKEALSPERKNSDEIFADIYALSSPKNKSELVKYAFSDFNFKFTPAVAVTLLESAETVETAKMIFDRSSIEKWDPGDSDLSAFFNGSIRYRNSGVQNYAYSVISKMFERMGRKEAVSFFSGIYEPKSVLFYVIKKRNLSLDDVNLLYNKMARILSTRDDDDTDPRYSNALDGLFKTILRYHSDKPELTAQFISNVANGDSLYNLLNYFKAIVKHFNGNIPYEIFKEMHRVMIDGLSKYGSVRSFTDTIITLTNLILKTNPSAVYVDNTATYIMDMLKSIGDNHYGYEDKVLKQVEEIYERIMRILRPRLSDRTAIELLSSYTSFSQKSDDLTERGKKIINYILSARRNSLTSPLLFNILNYSSRVGDDYFESMIGTLIDLQKNKLTRQDALEILRRANNKQMALDKLKDYIDNDWLKTIIGLVDPALKLQETMVKYSDYFINESMTHGSQIDLQQAFDVFDASYKKSTGQSWDFNKFASRAQDWTFFGDDNGYVAVREQRSGMIKLVGTAGSPKSVIAGFREMTSHYSGKAIWGAVSLEIATMLERLDPNFNAMRVPGGMAGKLLFKALKTMIPANVFGGAQIKDVNADGTITFEYSDVGQANKVMVGNKEYFDFLKNQIATDPRLSSYAPMINKLL
jgi:hypothetical protein